MKFAKSLSAVAMSLALAGGLVSAPALADLPKLPTASARIAEIDTNKNGRIEKEEYVAFMSAAFDKAAGEKGYCTFEEVATGFRQFYEIYGP